MSEDPAKARWMLLQAVRWSGMVMFVLGMLIFAGKIELPKVAGYVLMAIGLIDALFVPTLLARRWKTPR